MEAVSAALGAGARPVAAAAPRNAFVIGNVGKLGVELLNVLLECGRYARVAVAVERPLQISVDRLHAVTVPAPGAEWSPAQVLGRAPDDLFLCIEPRSVSYWKTTKPYVELTSTQALRVALRLRESGARRVMVVTPLEAMAQLGAVPMIHNTDELALIGAGFEKLLILRPTAEVGKEKHGGLFARLGAGVVRILADYMTPKNLQPVRARRAAQVALDAFETFDNGVHIVGAARLRELAGDPLEGRRPF